MGGWGGGAIFLADFFVFLLLFLVFFRHAVINCREESIGFWTIFQTLDKKTTAQPSKHVSDRIFHRFKPFNC